MKLGSRSLFLKITSLGLFFFALTSIPAESAPLDEQILDENCKYEEFEGICKIVNLYFNPEKSEGKLVKFRFQPQTQMNTKSLRILKERYLIDTDQEATLDNFTPAEWTRYQKIRLEIGDNVSCKLNISQDQGCGQPIFSMQEKIENQNAYEELESKGTFINISVFMIILIFFVLTLISARKIRKKRKKAEPMHKHKKKKVKARRR